MLARAVQCQPSDVALSVKVQLASHGIRRSRPNPANAASYYRVSRACAPRRPEGARARATSDFSARPGRATRIALRRAALAPARCTEPSASREPSAAVFGPTVLGHFRTSVPRGGGKVACATRTETRGDGRRAKATGTTRYAPVHDLRVCAKPVAPRSNLASRARGHARARSPRRSRLKLTNRSTLFTRRQGSARHGWG